MPLYTNNTKGTVSYQPEGFYNQGTILANDSANFAHDSWTYPSDFYVNLGKNQRVIGNLLLWYDSNNTSELKLHFKHVDKDDALVTATFGYTAENVITISTNVDATPAAANETQVIYSSDGDGPVITLDAHSANEELRFTRLSFNVFDSGSTNTILKLGFQEAADAGAITGATDCHLLAGSSIEYKKF